MTPDWQADYEALTTTCGVVPLTNWTQVQLTGKDRVSFLHNMCTNDIRRIEPGQSCEAFCTDVKGKILAHVLVIAEADRLQLLAVPGQAERIIKHLDRYIIREDVQLADLTADCVWNYAVGPRAADVSVTADLVVSCDWLWPNGFLVRTVKTENRPFEGLPIVDTSSPAWTALRVESGWPLYGTDFGESHLPQEIDRNARAISFTKGCYLGQETIARIDALGHVNKKLALVKFAGETVPTVGTKIMSGEQEVGTITTSTWSPQFAAPAAIAFLRRGANDLGTKLQTELGAAEVVPPLIARVNAT
ncbi:MAG: glycine cleavage T C-terminal barrel domain-containing protein [Bythopirellula sp.]|nr:glycine cleavage T C-terminal barrel domain-containing protein [Bythopirellula sp.]